MPSGWTALELDAATTDPESLSDGQLIDVIVGFDRVVSWAGARQAKVLAEFARRRPGVDREAGLSERASSLSRYAADEVGLALRLSRLTAGARIAQSVRLATVLCDTLAAWESGLVDGAKVRAICDAAHVLSDADAVAVQDLVLGRAGEQTVGQLRAAVNRAVLAVDPKGVAERNRRARRERRVVVGDERDGMASLWALMSAPEATASFQWLTRIASGMGDDPRGMNARRVDVMAGLLTGRLTLSGDSGPGSGHDAGGPDSGGPETRSPDTRSPDRGGPETPGPGEAVGGGDVGDGIDPSAWWVRPVNPGKPLVQIVMPYSTLVGVDEQPCELVGFGAIPASVAREVAADAVWHRLVTDPLSGALLDYGRTTYRPPAALADFVRARDVHCRSPICRRRAIDSELDHTVPYPVGPTAIDNLTAGCSGDHHRKHSPGWSVVQHADGRVTWRTPTGHTYTSEPHDYRPDPPPPARSGGEAPPPARRRLTVDEMCTAAPEDGLDPPPF